MIWFETHLYDLVSNKPESFCIMMWCWIVENWSSKPLLTYINWPIFTSPIRFRKIDWNVIIRLTWLSCMFGKCNHHLKFYNSTFITQNFQFHFSTSACYLSFRIDMQGSVSRQLLHETKVNFTNDFSAVSKIWQRWCYAVIQFSTLWSLQIFAHAPTAQLSWHV